MKLVITVLVLVSLIFILKNLIVSKNIPTYVFDDDFIFNLDDSDEDIVVPPSSFDPQLLELGTESAKGKKLLVVSLIRNCSPSIPCMIHKIHLLSKLFSQVHVCLFENNSTDDTRKRLLSYTGNNKLGKNVRISLINPFTFAVNEPECATHEELLSNDQRGGSLEGLGETRIARMTLLRNRVLDYIEKHQSEYDMVLMTDMDIIGRFFPKGIRETVGYLTKFSDMGFISFRGYSDRRTYFDPYSYCPAGGTATLVSGLLFLIQTPSNVGLIEVSSAHSGGIFANLPLQKGLRYNLEKSSFGYYLCEHVTMMRNVKNNFINTNMAFIVQDHV
jgi:hypothetical protein